MVSEIKQETNMMDGAENEKHGRYDRKDQVTDKMDGRRYDANDP